MTNSYDIQVYSNSIALQNPYLTFISSPNSPQINAQINQTINVLNGVSY